jgi:MFS family permease
MFWHVQHLRTLPSVATWTPAEQSRITSVMFFLVIGVSIVGNFFAAVLARIFGYRKSIALMCLGFFLAIFEAYRVPRDHVALMWRLPWVGFFSGVFALFTMYLPPLFPTLLRTTGAGFSYNIGRVAAAVGTVVFGLFATVSGEGDLRKALFYDAFLFLPAMAVALLLPELRDPKAEPAAPKVDG